MHDVRGVTGCPVDTYSVHFLLLTGSLLMQEVRSNRAAVVDWWGWRRILAAANRVLHRVDRIVSSVCDLLLRSSSVCLTVAANGLSCALAINRLHWVILGKVGLVMQ